MYFSPLRRRQWPSATSPFFPLSSWDSTYASYTSSSASLPSFLVTVALYASENTQKV